MFPLDIHCAYGAAAIPVRKRCSADIAEWSKNERTQRWLPQTTNPLPAIGPGGGLIHTLASCSLKTLHSEAPPAERVASGSPPEGGVYIGKAPLGLLVFKI